MLIRIALLLLFAALSLFLLMTASFAAGLVVLADVLRWLATETLFVGSVILVCTAVLRLIHYGYRQSADYFSASARSQRRLWFLGARKRQISQLIQVKKQQLQYFHNLKRRRLLHADNTRQVSALAKIVYRELKQVKHNIPHSHYQKLQQQMQRYKQQGDMFGLIDIQQQLSDYR